MKRGAILACLAAAAATLPLTSCDPRTSNLKVKKLQERVADLEDEVTRAREDADDESRRSLRDLESLRKDFEIERAGLLDEIERMKKAGKGSPAADPAPVAAAGRDAKKPADPKARDMRPYKAAVMLIEGDRSRGTGFLVNDAGTIYLYTAAHVFSGNSRITVSNSAGVTLSGFGSLEVADGADLARLAVLDDIPSGVLPLARPGTAGTATEIVALGDGGGVGMVSETSGKVLGVNATSVEVDAGVIQGNSGGPVVSLTTGQVIGLITHATNGRDDIWSQGTRLGGVRRFACRLDRDWAWKTLTLNSFMANSRSIWEYDRMTRLGFALGALEPTTAGLRLDTRLGGSTTVISILNGSRNLPIVAALLEMNTQLVQSRLRVSEADLRKRFRSMLSTAYQAVNQEGGAFHPDMYDPFHRSRVAESIEWRRKANSILSSRISSL